MPGQISADQGRIFAATCGEAPVEIALTRQCAFRFGVTKQQ